MSESECAAAGCEYESGSGWAECSCEEAMCASAGGQWQCEAFGPMAFKGFMPGTCDYDEDDDSGSDTVDAAHRLSGASALLVLALAA